MVQIEELQQQLGLMSVKTLKPEPAPLDLKVILVGDPALFALLQTCDREFMELFKVRAELGTHVTDTAPSRSRLSGAIRQYASSHELREIGLTGSVNQHGVLCKEEPQQHACAGRIPGHKVELADQESFPASDPPGYTHG